MHQFWKSLNDHTRTTYYVLPLIYLNKYSFGNGNFVNAYMTEDLSRIIVKVHSTIADICGVRPFDNDAFYDATEDALIYRTPDYYLANGDIQKFRAGQYSKMSPEARASIRLYSGLNWEVKKPPRHAGEEPRVESDARLLALGRHPFLRSWLEDELDVTIDERSELISAPLHTEFMAGVLQPSTL